MAIDLRPEWLDKIRPALLSAIKEIRVKKGMFLHRQSTFALLEADSYIPKRSPARRMIETIVDEFPLIEFILSTLEKELYDRNKYTSEIEQSALIEIDEYQHPEALVERLIDEFQTLPWDYVLTFKLPVSFSSFAPPADFQVSRDIWLRRGSQSLETRTPLEHLSDAAARRIKGTGFGSVMIGSAPKWEQNALYLQINLQGFIPPYGDSYPYRSAMALIKSFFGLLIAARVVKIRSRSFLPSPKDYVYVHKKLDGNYTADDKLEMNESISSLINRMEAFDNEGRVKDENTIRLWFMVNLVKVSKIFQGTYPSCSNLLLAGQWVFDSHTDPDPLLTYIRSMVVLEILLGSQKDAHELSIGDIITNRCAYMIGKDFEDRDKLVTDLKKIYTIRSQIVHRGKSQLTLEERVLMGRLQWIGQRVIQEEISRIPENSVQKSSS